MTDLIDGPAAGGAAPTRPIPSGPSAGPDEPEPAAPFLRWTMAACLAGAAAIHLAMVPGHVSEWAPEGVAFLVAGWVQLGLAGALLLRPRRSVVSATLATSTAFVAAWAWTRLWGPPFGPSSGVVEEASSIDLVCVALEALAAGVAVVALARPRLTARWSGSTLVLASVLPVAALAAGSVAIASPGAADHAHGGVAGEHDHDVVEDELGYHLLSNGHHHEFTWKELDPATQAELDRQLDVTRELVDTYATVADAEAAGYTRAGPYSPGLGAHFVKPGAAELNPDGVMTDEALRHPLSVMYDGTDPDSRLVGFMYYSTSPVEPTGFVGTNDTWHTHDAICLRWGPDGVDSPFGADLEATEEQCAQVGGELMPSTQWMVHVWTVPGYESADGNPFTEHHPALACSDGTYFRLPPEEWADNLGNVCRSKAPGRPSHDVTELASG